MSLRPLLTVQALEGPAGGSLYVRDFAMELFRQGHHPVIYCRRLGVVAGQLLNYGIPVVDDIRRLRQPDIIHGNSPIETVAAMLRFPDTPAIFVGHGWRSPDAMAPRLPHVMSYLAVSEHARDALVYFDDVPEELVTIHQNPVDLHRYPRRDPLPTVPRRGLVLSNSLSDLNYLPAIEQACKEIGVTVDVVGLSMGTARIDPESILREYDIVFAKGRSALDALATGCSVVLCDVSGFGELITTDNYDLLRFRNFGLRAMCLPPTLDTIRSQLQRYDPEDAGAVTDRVRDTEGLFAATASLVDIYTDAIEKFRGCDRANSTQQRVAVSEFLDRIAPFANTFAAAEQAAPLEQALRKSEGRLRSLAATLRMKKMEPLEAAQIRIDLMACPAEVAANEEAQAFIRVHNDSPCILSSFGDLPLVFSYHWTDQNGAVVVFDGIRSELFPPLPPGLSHTYRVDFVAPPAAGDYALRFTMVQEAVFWLEEFDVFSDTRCLVTS